MSAPLIAQTTVPIFLHHDFYFFHFVVYAILSQRVTFPVMEQERNWVASITNFFGSLHDLIGQLAKCMVNCSCLPKREEALGGGSTPRNIWWSSQPLPFFRLKLNISMAIIRHWSLEPILPSVKSIRVFRLTHQNG